jgi:hypothetical protein
MFKHTWAVRFTLRLIHMRWKALIYSIKYPFISPVWWSLDLCRYAKICAKRFQVRAIESNAAVLSNVLRRWTLSPVKDQSIWIVSPCLVELDYRLWSEIGAVVLDRYHYQITLAVHLGTEMILVPNSTHSSINSCNFHIIWRRPCFFNGLTRSIPI